jgi:hypothetical protein
MTDGNMGGLISHCSLNNKQFLDENDLGLNTSWCHAQPHSTIVDNLIVNYSRALHVPKYAQLLVEIKKNLTCEANDFQAKFNFIPACGSCNKGTFYGQYSFVSIIICLWPWILCSGDDEMKTRDENTRWKPARLSGLARVLHIKPPYNDVLIS